jgi:putative endonuclease
MKEHEYFVYIVSSNSGTVYIGMTNNIYRRALEHKQGEVDGFAKKYDCNRLVYYEAFDDVRKAIDREKQLKGWVRRKKIVLIESLNPRWADLAEKWGSPMAFAGESFAPNHCHPERSKSSRKRGDGGVEGPR